MIIKDAETTYDKLADSSGVPRQTIMRNSQMLFDMLEDLGMNSK